MDCLGFSQAAMMVEVVMGKTERNTFAVRADVSGRGWSLYHLGSQLNLRATLIRCCGTRLRVISGFTSAG